MTDPRIHGLDTAGSEVSYVYPGSPEVLLVAGVKMSASRAQRVALGTLLDETAPLEDSSWRWLDSTIPKTRRWVQHVVAACAQNETLVYEHDGEIILVWAFIPSRDHELDLLEAGFKGALATWRAPATLLTRTMALQMSTVKESAPSSWGVAPPPFAVDPSADLHGEHQDRISHAWLRWAAFWDTRTLAIGKRRYDFRSPAQKDGTSLVLRYRATAATLRISLDVARHPLLYDVTVSIEDHGTTTTHSFPYVGWEDFPTLLEKLGELSPAKPTKPGRKRKTAKTAKGLRVGGTLVTGPPPLSWGEGLVAAFNAQPGPRLRLEGRTGRGQADGLVFVVTREDGDAPLAVVDIVEEELDEIRWIDTLLRPSEQDAIEARLEQVLADAAAIEAAGSDKLSAGSSIGPLLAMLQRQSQALNVDLDSATKERPGGVHGLAVALQDLSTRPNTSPSAIAAYLNDVGLSRVADVLEDEASVAYSGVDQVITRVWETTDSLLPLVEVLFEHGAKVVDMRAVLPTTDPHHGELLVRHASRAGRMFSLATVAVQTEEPIPRAGASARGHIAITGEVAVGAKIYVLRPPALIDVGLRPTGGPAFIRQVVDHLTDLEHTLRKAPELLTDVRHLLFLTGALIEASGCQGGEQKAAMRAFQQAKNYYDAARRQLVLGKPAGTAERVHQAMQRIASSAAQISQSCAAGQTALPGSTPSLVVDAAAEELLDG
jgi:hypothetical protein